MVKKRMGFPAFRLGSLQSGRNLVRLLVLSAALVYPVSQQAGEVPDKPPVTTTPREGAAAKYKMRRVRGRVVWLNEALKRRYGITTVPEAGKRILALETSQGHLLPIVEDIRGRAFRRDIRLRQLDTELLVRQHSGSPMVQIIRVYAYQKGQRQEVDYWCEICAIAMYELKPCDCCQGKIALRQRPVAVSPPE